MSLISPWEVAIKVNQKKLDIGRPFPGFFDEQMTRCRFHWAPILQSHFSVISCLPEHHKDPFDRMLIAQAMTLGCPVVTTDANFAHYPISLIW